MARRCLEGRGSDGNGWVRLERIGMARFATVRHGEAGQARHVVERPATERLGEVRRGARGLVLTVAAGCGASRKGGAWFGGHGQAWHRQVRQGLECQGVNGLARHGTDRRGVSRRGVLGSTGQGTSGHGMAGTEPSVKTSTANTGTYQRRCKRCDRTDAVTVRVVESGEDWIVAVVSCGHCGVEADTVIGERGDRMLALLYARPRSKETAKLEATG